MSAALITASACRAKPERSAHDARTFAAVRPDLYHCEGCDGALERPSGSLSWSSRIGPANEPGEPLVVEGRVFRTDGHSPAPGVTIYAYQTNAAGLYANGTPETEWSRRHGRMRGWVRTDANGRYRFETIKPGPYPRQTMPAHIHLTVLEPGRRPYYIDDIVFDGEFGVTADYRRRQELRGGSGIVALSHGRDGRLVVRRDIVLESHPK
ncbi:MAG: hypothetical protein ABIO80_02755 [Sphingomicrobium sp.]